MKKLIAALFAVTMVSAASNSWAAFTSRQKASVTATATTAGTKAVSFSYAIQDIPSLGGAAKTSLTWTGIDPANLGGTNWKMSSQMLKLTSTITDLTGGIQLVTENMANDATPKFVDQSPSISSNTDSSPAGLMLNTVGLTSATITLPLAWSIKSSSLTAIAASDPNTGPTGNTPDYRFQWLFVVDKNSPAIDWNGDGVLNTTAVNGVVDTTAFVDGQVYSRMVDDRGIHFGQSPSEFGGGPGTKTSYVFFEADFTNALPQQTYSTNKLTIEAFTE